ncbi:MAG: hypothetical protein SP1CHLAM54_13710 [Chlamydiia bacterium]|nr:hypothetical protein [Chlamydiia bacterium]MCH9616264.1 hypothetical protein [Chlamydiia bacterium]MCH9629750.1 hypothetical protein [Chlamydiia bacterium]
MWTLISFYTPLYTPQANRLKTSCEKFNVPHLIEMLPCQGTWEENCALKPTFILEKLDQLKTPLLWVDADAEILRQPGPFEGDLSTIINLDLPETHPSRVGSGVVYLTPKARPIIEKWAAICKDFNGTEWDQVGLREALKNETATPLPKEYCMIDDRLIDGDNPIILHHQASRLLKKVIRGEVSPTLSTWLD